MRAAHASPTVSASCRILDSHARAPSVQRQRAAYSGVAATVAQYPKPVWQNCAQAANVARLLTPLRTLGRTVYTEDSADAHATPTNGMLECRIATDAARLDAKRPTSSSIHCPPELRTAIRSQCVDVKTASGSWPAAPPGRFRKETSAERRKGAKRDPHPWSCGLA